MIVYLGGNQLVSLVKSLSQAYHNFMYGPSTSVSHILMTERIREWLPIQNRVSLASGLGALATLYACARDGTISEPRDDTIINPPPIGEPITPPSPPEIPTPNPPQPNRNEFVIKPIFSRGTSSFPAGRGDLYRTAYF